MSPAVPAALVVPGEAPVPERWQVGPDGRYPGATRMWLADLWGSWLRANSICWAVGGDCLLRRRDVPWPFWVSVPWGVVLLFNTIGGLSSGAPQRWAAKRHRKEAERRLRSRPSGRQEGAVIRTSCHDRPPV